MRRIREGSGRSPRGYSLVEMAIALAVIGIVAGGAVLPIGSRLRDQVYERADEQMGQIVDAIIGYAAANRTNGMMLLFSDYDPSIATPQFGAAWQGQRTMAVPANRPYLPCPDVDGDGHEDRRSHAARPGIDGNLAPDYDAAEARFIYRPVPSGIADTDPFISNVPFGACARYSGMVPYRTLGLEPRDPWGSYHTYIVNPNFAMASFGFDQHTRAVSYRRFSDENLYEGPTDPLTAALERKYDGGMQVLPCRLGHTLTSGSNDFGCSQSIYGDSRSHEIGSANPYDLRLTGPDPELDAPGDQPFDIAGTQDDAAGHGRNMASFKRYRALNLITDGLPFAIISHGMDRQGAPLSSDLAAEEITCPGGTMSLSQLFGASSRNVAGDIDTAAEEANAAYSSCVNGDGFTGPSSPFDATSDDFEFIDSGTLPPYAWIVAFNRASTSAVGTRVPGGVLQLPDDGIFDDVVTWLTRRELAHRMRRAGVFPLDESQLYPGMMSMLASYELQ